MTRTIWGVKVDGLTGDYESNRCPCCRREKKIIVKMARPYGYREVREETRIGGEAAVCTNSDCPLFTDLALAPSWV